MKLPQYLVPFVVFVMVLGLAMLPVMDLANHYGREDEFHDIAGSYDAINKKINNLERKINQTNTGSAGLFGYLDVMVETGTALLDFINIGRSTLNSMIEYLYIPNPVVAYLEAGILVIITIYIVAKAIYYLTGRE